MNENIFRGVAVALSACGCSAVIVSAPVATVSDGCRARFNSSAVPPGYRGFAGVLPGVCSASGNAVPVFVCVQPAGAKTPRHIREFIDRQAEKGCAAGIVSSASEVRELLQPFLRG